MSSESLRGYGHGDGLPGTGRLVHYTITVAGVQRILSVSPRHVVGFTSRPSEFKGRRSMALLLLSNHKDPLELPEENVHSAVEKWRHALWLERAYEGAENLRVLNEILASLKDLRAVSDASREDREGAAR